MIQYRFNVFETNSSSVHTLVISKNIPNAMPNKIQFNIGEFGWEVEEYNDIQTRADYFYTAACSILGYDVRDELSDKLGPYGIEVGYGRKHPLFRVYSKNSCPYLDNGYIDHVDELEDFVDRCMNDTDYLVRWLFGYTSVLYTSNDNLYDYENQVIKVNDDEEVYIKGN